MLLSSIYLHSRHNGGTSEKFINSKGLPADLQRTQW
jgi:hypothetical protein